MHFEETLLRLKQRLGLQSDKQVAQVLGLSPTAFGDRKKRDAFPADRLRAVAQKNPDWNLDVEYVLTGTSEREAPFESSISGLKAATQKVLALKLPEREQRFVRDVVWGVEMQEPDLVVAAIDEFRADCSRKKSK